MLSLPHPMLFIEPSEFFFTAGYDSPLGHLDLAMSERGLAVVALHGQLGRSAWKPAARRRKRALD